MNDEELCKRLRGWGMKTPSAGADRIEALTEQLEQLVAINEAARADADEAEAYAWQLEQRLAKAVEGLRVLADCVDDGCYCSEMRMATAMDIARATLAEIEAFEYNDDVDAAVVKKLREERGVDASAKRWRMIEGEKE